MEFINKLIDKIVSNHLTEPIVYKHESELQLKYDALMKLKDEINENKELEQELVMVKKGLIGENEIEYQLMKSDIGMYILRDIKVKYKDLKAQIDYIVITPIYTYFIECKNLMGNITIDSKGNFIREWINSNKQKQRIGMPSPLNQVENQRNVMKKIKLEKASSLDKLMIQKYFEDYNKVLVVVANQYTILNKTKAPKSIQSKVVRADRLNERIKYDLKNAPKDENKDNKSKMEERAKRIVEKLCINENKDYYLEYKERFTQTKNTLKSELEDLGFKYLLPDEYNKIVMDLNKRKEHYVFTDAELEELLKYKPTTIETLIKLKILPQIKIKCHGQEIINEIIKYTKNT